MAACCAASSRSAVLTWKLLISGATSGSLGVGLGHLDHLGAPDIADVGVGERDVVRRVGHLLVLHRLRVAKRLVAGGGIECAGGRAGLLRPGQRPEATGATEAKPDGAGPGGRAANDGTATQPAV